MEKPAFETPILFMIYHRPDLTRRVFEEIKKQKPKKLFIAAGAPKNAEDQMLCEETRKITESIDWECDVHRLYEKVNVGSGLGCKNSIDWFFSQVEEGIILEDDCLPGESFFTFSKELLSKYRNDSRVMMVSGDNFLRNTINIKESYYFSHIPLCWGWATWKRVWDLYDYEMKDLPTTGEKKIRELIKDTAEQKYWLEIFYREFNSKKKNWDYPLAYTIWMNNGVCINPSTNLVTNIGFGEGAEHTLNSNHPSANMEMQTMNFPLIHPKEIAINWKADSYVFRRYYLRLHGLRAHIRKLLLAYSPDFVIGWIRALRSN